MTEGFQLSNRGLATQLALAFLVAGGCEEQPPTTVHVTQPYQTVRVDFPVSCGIAATYLLLDRMDDRRSLTELLATSSSVEGDTLSLHDLRNLLQEIGYEARALYVPHDNMLSIRGPFIALLNDPPNPVGHFVVLESCEGGMLYLDPIRTPSLINPRWLRHVWTGKILVARPRG